MINTHWGRVVEDNSFGTHEFCWTSWSSSAHRRLHHGQRRQRHRRR
ncbi:MAG: hypothetical protein U0599_01115 [Vicinamibacteria bacterium]